jgi:hypothetical protein
MTISNEVRQKAGTLPIQLTPFLREITMAFASRQAESQGLLAASANV